jgi:hypothetical protein
LKYFLKLNWLELEVRTKTTIEGWRNIGTEERAKEEVEEETKKMNARAEKEEK